MSLLLVLKLLLKWSFFLQVQQPQLTLLIQRIHIKSRQLLDSLDQLSQRRYPTFLNPVHPLFKIPALLNGAQFLHRLVVVLAHERRKVLANHPSNLRHFVDQQLIRFTAFLVQLFVLGDDCFWVLQRFLDSYQPFLVLLHDQALVGMHWLEFLLWEMGYFFSNLLLFARFVCPMISEKIPCRGGSAWDPLSWCWLSLKGHAVTRFFSIYRPFLLTFLAMNLFYKFYAFYILNPSIYVISSILSCYLISDHIIAFKLPFGHFFESFNIF